MQFCRVVRVYNRVYLDCTLMLVHSVVCTMTFYDMFNLIDFINANLTMFVTKPLDQFCNNNRWNRKTVGYTFKRIYWNLLIDKILHPFAIFFT